MISRIRVKRDDIVKIISGKENGKKGKVIKVIPSEYRIIVEGLNIVKRHTKPKKDMKEGGIVEKEAKINISNVMVVCTSCNKPVRISMKFLEEGNKVRICKKCGEMIDNS